MQFLKCAALTAALTFVFSLGAFAKNFDSGNFDLTQPARIGSTMLQPGHYKAEWSGSGSALQVSILSHGKTVATTQGHLKELPTKSPYTAVSLRERRDNTRQVDEIDFNNHHTALVLPRA